MKAGHLTKKQQQEVEEEVNKQLENRFKDKLSITTSSIRSEFRKQLSTALLAAFGLVIALSWQSVIKKFIDSIPTKSETLANYPYLADLYTALIVTFLCAIAILIISTLSKTEKPN